MFEKKIQSFLNYGNIAYALIIAYAFFIYSTPEENVTITIKDLKSKSYINGVAGLATMYLYAEYMKQSNSLFCEIKEYCDGIDLHTREKETFFACMSHEIRNPIQSIMGSLELMMPVVDRGKNELVEICKCGSEVVLNLISNILDISKIQAGKMELSVCAANPRETVSKIFKLLKQKAQGKGINLIFAPNCHLPPAIEFDPHRLSQVILNLVTNAIKFTQQGEVKIEMKWNPIAKKQSFQKMIFDNLEEILPQEPKPNRLSKTYTRKYSGFHTKDDTTTKIGLDNSSYSDKESPNFLFESRGILEISISDTGIGIRQENLDNLFKPYQQADAEISRHFYIL